mmetsp:Transcript_13822/g.27625  ORF Transcript_13822/g.27625 Transcript_13822/m.27625 type:complete len:197 (-) Transcript_13822:119-709(-)
MLQARRYAALFEVYDSVSVRDSYCIIRMKHRGDSVVKSQGFNVWRSLSDAQRRSSLEKVILGLLELCHVGWISCDCRLQNIVVDTHGNLTAIDLDWIQHRAAFIHHTAPGLWYPDCTNPLLYISWQAYVCAVLLSSCASLQALAGRLVLLHKGDAQWGGGTFNWFETEMLEAGWTRAEEDPKAVLGFLMSMVDRAT